MKKSFLLVVAICVAIVSMGQTPVEPTIPNPFEKNFRWGISVEAGSTNISDKSVPYFSKASLGAGVNAEYYVFPFLGFGAGLGYQQRGAGIKNDNQVPVVGPAPDSTYRLRLRFNTLEIPLSVFIRTPKDIVKGVRLSGSFSVVPIKNLNSKLVFNVLEPSTVDENKVQNVSSDYFASDLAYQWSIGPEIAMGSSCVKIHFVGSTGTSNVYRNGGATGHNQLKGIRLTVFF